MLKIVETNSAAPKRRYPDAKLLVAQDQQPCQIEELSRWAACVRSDPSSTIDEGADVVLEIDGSGQVPAEVVTMPAGLRGRSIAPKQACELVSPMVSVGIKCQIGDQRPRFSLRQVNRDGSRIAERETRQ